MKVYRLYEYRYLEIVEGGFFWIWDILVGESNGGLVIGIYVGLCYGKRILVFNICIES